MSAASVPPRYLGLWRRVLLSAPGVHDQTTLVLWMQTPQWHADLRIPIDRPDCTGCRAVEDCSADQLLGLLRQEGFAGFTTVNGDICEWHRRFDYRPTGRRDLAAMRFTPSGDAIDEIGVEADYAECWERVSTADGPQAWLVDASEGVPVVWLRSGVHFMRVRQSGLAAAASAAAWRAARAGQADLSTLRSLVDFTIDFGNIEGAHGLIRHATLPWREGLRIALPERIATPAS